MAQRDEFAERQIAAALAENAQSVADRWRDEFRGGPPHYICEECSFVSPNRQDFHLDHVIACATGGTNDRHSAEIVERLMGSNPDPAYIYQIGLNIRVLCAGCNLTRGKKTFVPTGRGYAYTRHGEDLNPDHIYSGVPRT
jgi:hypothetical protein